MIRPKVKKTLKVNDTPKKVKEIKATILNQEYIKFVSPDLISFKLLTFIFSKKATKIDKIFTVNLTLIT